jgi:hypothetical protein
MNDHEVLAARFTRRVSFFDEPKAIADLERLAAEHRRSMSAEIRSAIRKSLEQEQRGA